MKIGEIFLIVDADVHISPSFESGNSIKLEELVKRMDKAEVDKALTWLQPPYRRDNIEASNKYIFEATKRFPERIIGFGWADPNLGVNHAKSMVKKCVYDYGFYGVK